LTFTPDLLVGRLSGPLQSQSREPVRTAFRDALSYRPERLVIDTAGLTVIDEPELLALLEVLRRSGPDYTPIAIAGHHPRIRRAVETVPADRRLEIMTFSSLDEAVGGVMAEPGAPAPDQQLLLAQVRNLHRALLSRGVIEQAKGILMAVCDLDADAAFALLTWHSRNTRTPIRELATRFVTAARNYPMTALTPARTDALLTDLANGCGPEGKTAPKRHA
jgi:hypothetical protein